jgi:hypothetical protein
MTLQEQNEACRLQSKMSADGFNAEFPRVFARALPSSTGHVDWTAVVIFESWAELQPNLRPALDFLNQTLDFYKFERKAFTTGTLSTLQEKLSGVSR